MIWVPGIFSPPLPRPAAWRSRGIGVPKAAAPVWPVICFVISGGVHAHHHPPPTPHPQGYRRSVGIFFLGAVG